MPVPRKRKKNRKSNRGPGPGTSARRHGPDLRQQEMAAAMAGFAGYRRQLDERRAVLATAAARPMIADLVDLATTLSDPDLADQLCLRLGRALAELDGAGPDEHVDPNTFAGAVIDVAVEAVNGALAGQDSGWMPPWRVLVTVAGIVNHPLRERAADAIDDLRTRPGGNVLPDTCSSPAPAGPVLWTRDGYGSRFGVAAVFRTGEGVDRWYLWDIDACGHDTFTVHSRYHSTADEALADWQAGVGATAADGTAFAPVDDPDLLAELMPRGRESRFIDISAGHSPPRHPLMPMCGCLILVTVTTMGGHPVPLTLGDK